MSTQPAVAEARTPLAQLQLARQVLQVEGDALNRVRQRLGGSFCDAVQVLWECTGSVIVTGMGKAGLVGQKIAATMASTGTRAHFLHPAEAVHGDLGRIHADDAVLALSYSGQTEELTRLLPALEHLGVAVVAITSRQESTLGRHARAVVDLGPLEEACPLGLAPSTSTTAMLAVGDALALVLSRMHGFQQEDFAQFHPAGSLGRKFTRVEAVMRRADQLRIASGAETVREVYVALSRPGRRSGAIMLVDDQGHLSGLFTDSDLARLFETRCDDALDQPIHHVMTPNPATIRAGSLVSDAVEVLIDRKISELPVVDASGRPVGLIDVTDAIAWAPKELNS